jgi:hypothetical protein
VSIRKALRAVIRMHTSHVPPRTMVLPQPTLDAVIEGRNRGIKEWELQERTGVRQEML